MTRRNGARIRIAAAAAALLALAGCTPADDEAPVTAEGVQLPVAGSGFDYQLGGASPPGAGTTVVARDSSEAADPDAYGICYVNGFQTQPGVAWPDELLLHDDAGEPVTDPDWPDETLLDISTEAQREGIAARIGELVDQCAANGYLAVEFDNLDSYTRSGDAFTDDDAIAMAAAFVDLAHERDLAAAQKNASELTERAHEEAGYDFAVVEECAQFAECGVYREAYGDLVFDIEYTDAQDVPFADACADADTPPSTILRDRDLVQQGDPDHVYERC